MFEFSAMQAMQKLQCKSCAKALQCQKNAMQSHATVVQK
jgi:hypothetical protein